MGIGDAWIVGELSKNAEEVKRKNDSGEKLSFMNYLLLILQIGILVCCIAFAYFILKFIFQVIL